MASLGAAAARRSSAALAPVAVLDWPRVAGPPAVGTSPGHRTQRRKRRHRLAAAGANAATDIAAPEALASAPLAPAASVRPHHLCSASKKTNTSSACPPVAVRKRSRGRPALTAHPTDRLEHEWPRPRFAARDHVQAYTSGDGRRVDARDRSIERLAELVVAHFNQQAFCERPREARDQPMVRREKTVSRVTVVAA